MEIFNKAMRRLLLFVFPRDLYCAICEKEMDGDDLAICQTCAQTLQPKKHTLSILPLDEVMYAFDYSDAVRRCVLGYKYENKKHKALFLADAMRCFDSPQDATLVPVPMHKARKSERHFSHIDELCEELSRLRHLPLDKKAIKRIRNTPSQTTLDADGRKSNLLGAFSADKNRVFGKNIVLVDDVISTGATLSECAKSLKAAGAKSVIAWAIAH